MGLRDTETVTSSNEWYWDINRKIAVPASERGSFDHVLGPYASQQAAENWAAKVEKRNDDWDGDDDQWERAGVADEPDVT